VSLVWEEDYSYANARAVSWHLKMMVPAKDPMATAPFSIVNGPYAKSLAWVTKLGDRKWDCQFVNHDGSRTFRSLKAAKAYAVAVVTLE